MGSRYFLIPFLPPLSIEALPEMSLGEVEFFLQQNLSTHEMATVHQLYAIYDLENIRSFFLDLPMAAIGSIPSEDLREMLENDECPLPMLAPFFARHPSLEERKRHAHELVQQFFTALPPFLPAFVRQYFWVEHTSRQLMAYLRAKALGKTYDINGEELGFDPSNAQHWPALFTPLLSLWQPHHRSPLTIEHGYAKWKFDTIGALCADSPPLSLNILLAYLLQLRLVESRRALKSPVHQNIVERISKAVQ